MRVSVPDLRSEELLESWNELNAAGEEARELAADLTRDQLRWRPEEAAWSVGGCLEHLVLAGEAYLEVLDEAIAGSRERGLTTDGSYRPSLVGRWLARLLEPPPGLKIPAPGRIRPRLHDTVGAGSCSEDPLRAFLELRSRLGERMQAADGLDLGRTRLGSPFVPLLRFDLGSAFRIVVAHERRHLWQARRVLESEQFPA